MAGEQVWDHGNLTTGHDAYYRRGHSIVPTPYITSPPKPTMYKCISHLSHLVQENYRPSIQHHIHLYTYPLTNLDLCLSVCLYLCVCICVVCVHRHWYTSTQHLYPTPPHPSNSNLPTHLKLTQTVQRGPQANYPNTHLLSITYTYMYMPPNVSSPTLNECTHNPNIRISQTTVHTHVCMSVYFPPTLWAVYIPQMCMFSHFTCMYTGPKYTNLPNHITCLCTIATHPLWASHTSK